MQDVFLRVFAHLQYVSKTFPVRCQIDRGVKVIFTEGRFNIMAAIKGPVVTVKGFVHRTSSDTPHLGQLEVSHTNKKLPEVCCNCCVLGSSVGGNDDSECNHDTVIFCVCQNVSREI